MENNTVLKGVIDYIMENSGKKKEKIYVNENYRTPVWDYKKDLHELYNSLSPDDVQFFVQYLRDTYSIEMRDINGQ